MSAVIWMDGRLRPFDNWAAKAASILKWEGFLLRTYPTVLALDLPPLDAAQTERTAVIVEPRNHPHLEYVIRNVLYFLGPGWSLCVCHGTNNKRMVDHIVSRLPGDRPKLVDLGVANLTIPDYNRLLTSEEFWRDHVLPAEQVLVFQTDSILRVHHDHPTLGIDVFLPGRYDYVGAPWHPSARPLGLEYGNGGISLRRREAMLRVVRDHPYDPALVEPEDVHFSLWCRMYDDARLPDVETARRFSTESYCLWPHGSLAVHPDHYMIAPHEMDMLLAGVDYRNGEAREISGAAK